MQDQSSEMTSFQTRGVSLNDFQNVQLSRPKPFISKQVSKVSVKMKNNENNPY